MTMRYYLIILFAGLFISLSSCRKDFAFEQNSGGLEFSKDTIFLDTVFHNIGSSTYRLKVYNRSDKDISIPEIKLNKGNSSKYRIMVDGMTGEDADNNGVGDGKIFKNVELLAKDSMYVFIEVTADIPDANPTDFLYIDKIEFSNISGAPQTVELVTLIQDCYFIYPQRVLNSSNQYLYESINLGLDDDNAQVISAGSNLDHADPENGDEYHWKNDKPYVIYGYAFVPDGETLIVDAGARIHFHANSGLIVGNNATIKINGANPSDFKPLNTTNEVIFEGDRLEPQFSDVPGQWGTIMILSKKTDNSINHLTIKNATVGILMQNIATATNATDIPYLNIKNSQILNCSNVGILARKSKIDGENLVGNYCGQATLACTYGGVYNFNHCTFNNDWNNSKQVAVLLNNYLETTNSIYVHNLDAANFTNCIVYGSNQIEMFLDKKTDLGVLFNYNFKNSIIKFNNINNAYTNNADYQFSTDVIHYNNNYIATNYSLYNPKYKNTNKNQMWPTEDLFSVVLPFSQVASQDILGKPRNNTNANLGAYQFIPN